MGELVVAWVEMKKLSFYFGVLGVLAVTIAGPSGCARAPSAPRVTPPPTPKEIASADGLCRLTVPPTWSEDNDLYPGAELQVSNKKEELFVVVMAESKSELDGMTKEKYSRITRRALAKSLKAAKTTGPNKMTVGGAPGLQYQISGKMDGMEVVYLHTAIEGRKSFYQVLAWTQKGKFDEARPGFEQIIGSFKEAEASRLSNKK